LYGVGKDFLCKIEVAVREIPNIAAIYTGKIDSEGHKILVDD